MKGDSFLKTWLAEHKQFVYADCYTFDLITGDKLYYTTAQKNIIVLPPSGPAIVYLAKSVQVDGLLLSQKIGVSVDEQDMNISAKWDDPAQVVQGMPILTALRLGLFDGGTIRRDRYFMATWADDPVAGVTMFEGRISSFSDIGITTARGRVKATTVLLNMQMPRNTFGAGCIHTLFDSGCGLAKGSFATSGTVGSSPSTLVIPWGGATADYFTLGTVTFASGPNAGVSRSVKRSTGSALILNYPLDYLPGAGDIFVAYAGCNKTLDTCENKFSNLDNFRGFPFVPQPQPAV